MNKEALRKIKINARNKITKPKRKKDFSSKRKNILNIKK